VFYHDESQKIAAENSRAGAAVKQGLEVDAVQTTIASVGKFTYAEGYHQKYYLTRFEEIRDILTKAYKTEKELADSTVATRLNAYLGSGMKRDWAIFIKELPDYGMPEELGKTANKIRSMHTIKLPQLIPQIHRVAHFKSDSASIRPTGPRNIHCRNFPCLL
ncbi:peptide-methionine (S)-S-oxide reductase, partial [Akkermansiaceae bacterium]|nr:peptide-methionine (S)-S-oxide reductase [Akkermansiaceae bacterium]